MDGLHGKLSQLLSHQKMKIGKIHDLNDDITCTGKEKKKERGNQVEEKQIKMSSGGGLHKRVGGGNSPFGGASMVARGGHRPGPKATVCLRLKRREKPMDKK